MKKFFLYLFLIVALLVGLFVYILYSEGAFESIERSDDTQMKPFEMKCEAGKCAAGKCAAAK